MAHRLTFPILASFLLPTFVPGQVPPARADTLLSALPTFPVAELLPVGVVTFTTGYVSPFRASREGSGGTGTGNQSYQGEIGWGVSERLALHLGIEVNDDPTYAPVRGERRARSLVAAALAARTVLWSSGTPARPGAPPGLSVGLQATAQAIWQGSGPGLFNAGVQRDERVFGAFALDLPLTLGRGERAGLTLTPSVATLPRSVMGAPYYGTMVRLGAGARLRLDDAWTLIASGELPLGPGDNVVDDQGALSRTATWRAGVRWRGTPRVVLDGYLTNGAGVTPVTRHLTLPSDPRVLYGVGILYTPSVAEPGRGGGSGARPSGRRAQTTAGVGLPPFRALAPGRGRVDAALDGAGAWTLHFQHALGYRFQVELLATRLRGADAPGLMGARMGSSWEYRFAGVLGLADEAEGDPVSWAHRVSVGRDWESQQGYLLAEIIASRRLARGVRLVANPLAVHSGGRSPVSVGLGGRVDVGALSLLPEWRASFSGHRPVWTLGAAMPGHVAGLPALDATLYVTNASGVRGLGRILADPGGFRAGVVLGVGF